jgi:hypothetical protein
LAIWPGEQDSEFLAHCNQLGLIRDACLVGFTVSR